MVAEPVSVAPRRPQRLLGRTEPRIAPPRPARSEVKAFEETALGMGITLMPWQKVAGRYLMARDPDGSRPYREVAILVARQNGKTTLMKPFIIHALRAGKRVMHIAQSRELPRHMFGIIADALSNEPGLFPKRRGKVIWPRYGAGQEEIMLLNGGSYRLAASRTGGARGWSNDVVLIDELREMESFDIINAAEPTLMMSPDPLMVYLSNAGVATSVVLNSVQDRAGSDPGLAFLSWSAPPEAEADDRAAWAQANPALGHQPSVRSYLESAYTRHKLAGTMTTFEVENLCRSVQTMSPPIVTEEAWEKARGDIPDAIPPRAAMAVKVDPQGRRASAVVAWRDGEDICVRSFAEDISAPLDVDAFAADLLPLMRRHRVWDVGFDAATDRDLARHLPERAQAVNGQMYQAACQTFVRLVEGGQLRHADDGTIGEDFEHMARRDTPTGWYAMRSGPETATAAEATIRAVWLASAPRRTFGKVH